jgi:streptomycin 6-kinase
MNNILKHNIINLYGESGKNWLEQLPDFLKKCENTLKIKLRQPFHNLSYNYVAQAILSDGSSAVFKCGVPNKELASEIAALAHFAGNGAANLIAADAKDGWLLIEKVESGTRLSTIDNDDEATRIIIGVMQKMNYHLCGNDKMVVFSTIASWLEGFKRLYKKFDGNTGPFPQELIKRADLLSQELLQSMGEAVLLHGDLHHDNVLSSNRDFWLAIDPKGVIGEAEYEIGALMKNPMPRLVAALELKKLFLRRIDIIIEMTGFERYRVIGWSFIIAILSAWWVFEDNSGDINPLIYCAEVLESILKKQNYILFSP